jgi:site-specific DNA-methyltransferase (adenine-specific)
MDMINHSNNTAKEYSDHLTSDQFPIFFRRIKKLLSEKGSIIAFGQDKFTFRIYNELSNIYQYSLIWKKGNRITGHLNSKTRPLINHNEILIFQKSTEIIDNDISQEDKIKGKIKMKKVHGYHIYNPQMSFGIMRHASISNNSKRKQDRCYGVQTPPQKEDTDLRYPTSVLEFNTEKDQLIPLQKPQDLMDWIVLTYSDENSIVFDPCMGAGTSAISCKKFNRKYLGTEINPKIYEMAKERIQKYIPHKRIPLP